MGLKRHENRVPERRNWVSVGGLFGLLSVWRGDISVGSSSVVSNNYIRSEGRLGGVRARNSYVSCNFIYGAEHGVYAIGGNTIEGNLIYNNWVGIWEARDGNVIRNNTIVENKWGIILYFSSTIINYNNLQNNADYNILIKPSQGTGFIYIKIESTGITDYRR